MTGYRSMACVDGFHEKCLGEVWTVSNDSPRDCECECDHPHIAEDQ